jgi:glycosyltransferase involved in cell wall biosynthesis
MITFNAPINPLSFGNVSVAILREAYKANLDCCIFPIGGQVDLSTQNPDDRFNKWLENTIKESPRKHSRDNRVLKLWHINGSLESYGKEQELLTFHETDSIGNTEINILKNQKTVWVTSNYTKSVFEEAGLTNVKYIPLGFDTHNFKKLNKKYYDEGVTVVGFGGKLERRKNSLKVLKLLVDNFGNNPKFMIHAAITNPFFKKEDNEALIGQVLQGKKYSNLVILPFMPTNAQYNDFLNSCDIFLGMSGGEGRDLPVYQAASLGKKIVALNAHAYQDYLNHDNSWLVEPNGKTPAVDNVFFHQNSEYNIGNFYTWDDNEFLTKLNDAVKSPPKREFKFDTYKDTFNHLFV